jgi:hypothetical protein
VAVCGVAAWSAIGWPGWALEREGREVGAPALSVSAWPDVPAPAFAIPTPRTLAAAHRWAQTATVLRATFARVRPDPAASIVATIGVRTPERTSNLVLVVGRARNRFGALWVRVRLPVLPNGSTGWVPRDALGVYRVVRTRLDVDLHRFTATLFDGGREVFHAAIGVGTSAFPTPRGHFFVRSMLRGYASPFYGPIAFGTSARSSALTDWPDGGFIGIHGTSSPERLPGRVSHGCIRMRNADILRLARLMPVGTPVTIR